MTFVRACVLSCIWLPMGFAGDVRLKGDEHFFVNGLVRDVAVGDFDGDGRLDVATAVEDSNSTSRLHLLRGDGFGSFIQTTTPFGSTPGVIVAGDFDGDGDLDLMIGSGGTAPTFSFENDGSGAFTDPGWSTFIGDPTDLEVGDVDLDGDLDVVAAAPASGLASDHLRVLLGNGAFSFALQPELTEPATPNALTLRDLDLDGDLDIASVVPTTSTLRVRLGTAGGVFGSLVSIATGTSPKDVVAMDVKGDGILDLVTSASGAASIAIHFGTGSGGFGVGLLRPTGNGPTALAVGRLDSDGFDDLVVETDLGVYVHRGLAIGLEANGTPQQALFGGHRLLLAQLDGDLQLDAISTDGGPHVARAFGDGIGGFVRAASFGAPSGGSNSNVDLEFADLDVDGDLDSLECFDNGVFVRLATAPGSFAATTTLTGMTFSGSTTQSFFAPDLNADGRPDLVAASYSHLGTRLGFGNGTFGAQSTFTYTTFLQSLAVGDFDGDGDIDAALGELDSIPAKVQFRFNNGGGALITTGTVPIGTSSSDPLQPSIAALDFDQDGKLDLAAIDAAGVRRAKLLRGLGGGSFTQVQVTNLNARGQSITSGDIDGDGFDDVICGGGGNHSHDISGFALRSNGTQFGSVLPLDYKAGSGPFATTWVKDAALADVNGDGFRDAMFAGTSHEAFSWNGHYEVVYFPGKADGTFDAPRSFAAGASAHAITALDLDGDSRAEIGAVGSDGAARLSILEHECDGKAGTFGSGCVGSGAITPRLGFQGCPTPGGSVALRVDHGLGGATALLFVGVAPAALPVSIACDLLTVPVLAPLAVQLGGVGAGAGEITIPLTLPGGLGAIPIVLQAFVVDPGTTLGASATAGVLVLVE